MSRADLKTNKSEEYFSDFPMNFDINPTTGNLAKITNERAISQAIKNRVLTNLGERPYNIFFGSKIKSSLFELAGPDVADFIMTVVKNACSQESRIALADIKVYDDSNRNGYRVAIFYTIINTQAKEKVDLFLKRVR